ncbi:hypothetical protein HJ590_11220 [Naumannella sp. ID2617S]|uniref:DUF4352 domain-containing protein n=1 Tax=Enemella dayhoffiae TaxID=2016507 RepID=A0A255HFT1_9ACTN|nr:hypothetical protein [Enemella dayhoffiae]NNG20133.1 hypothetical protein [Naumannella sp. ID2617S]OYO25334.1 hypothetical protein CGZ93_02525 [Enemella dayhoffiae]
MSPATRVGGGRPRNRLRAWLALWCVCMLAAVYVAGWAFWSYTHQNLRFVQLPPGESAVTGKGSPFRVLSINQARSVPVKYGKPVEASPGMTFVLVRFEVTRVDPKDYCLLNLAGADRVFYEYTTRVSGRPLNQFCQEWPTNVATEGEVIYEVPLSRVNQIAGVYASDQRDWRTRHLVASPPR